MSCFGWDSTLYTLDRALYQLSYRGSSAGWAQISHLIVHLIDFLRLCPRQLEEEEEEEEARMVESKEDSVRRLRQKMSTEREKEEREMRERAEKSRQELAQQLEREKVCIHLTV